MKFEPLDDATFWRVMPYGKPQNLECLRDSYGGTRKSSAWLIGSGPSLASLPCDEINRSPAPKMCMNLAGRGKDGQPPLITPTMWTAYDPTASFSRSIFLNPSIKKFLLGGRTLDLIPDGNEKVCDCPDVVMMNHEYRRYEDFIRHGAKVINCNDSMIQAIDILYHLGFRRIYCVGTEMRIRPSQGMIDVAHKYGVEYENDYLSFVKDKVNSISDRLNDFVDECTKKEVFREYSGDDLSLTDAEKVKNVLCAAGREEQYSFSEQKTFMAALATDNHYFNCTQYLRLGRRSMALAGLEIISCTPGSRLNDYFPYVAADVAIKEVWREVGDPGQEVTAGRYSNRPAPNDGMPIMSDIPPNGWKNHDELRNEENEKRKKDGVIAGNDPPGQVDRMRVIEKFKKLQKEIREK